MKKILLKAALIAAFLIPVAAQAADGFATANVNMRSGPSTRYPAVVVIPNGEPVEIHGCLAETPWCDVSFYGGRGWVSGQYVQAVYQRQRVYVAPRYYRPLGIPTVTFELGNYWDRNYRSRDFYRDRDYWRGGPDRVIRDRPRFDRDRPRFDDDNRRDRDRDRDWDRNRDRPDRDRDRPGRDRDRFFDGALDGNGNPPGDVRRRERNNDAGVDDNRRPRDRDRIDNRDRNRDTDRVNRRDRPDDGPGMSGRNREDRGNNDRRRRGCVEGDETCQ